MVTAIERKKEKVILTDFSREIWIECWKEILREFETDMLTE
jgi:hypothetical protein